VATWGFWDWIGYGGLWVAVVMTAVEESKKRWPNALNFLPAVRGVFAFAPLVLVSVATVILVAKALGPAPTPQIIVKNNVVRVPVPEPSQAKAILILQDQIAIDVDLLKGKLVTPSAIPSSAPSAPNSKTQQPTYSTGAISGNQGILTFGQTGNNTIVQGTPRRRLDENLKAQLLANLPTSRKVEVNAINESDAKDFAAEIATFLRENGYTVDGVNTNFYGGPNPKGTTINLRNDPIVITVGENTPPNGH
jgi:hypothetical protein